MTPEQLIEKIQKNMQTDERNWVEKADTIAAIQQLVDENKNLRQQASNANYYEDVLVDLGYLRYA